MAYTADMAAASVGVQMPVYMVPMMMTGRPSAQMASFTAVKNSLRLILGSLGTLCLRAYTYTYTINIAAITIPELKPPMNSLSTDVFVFMAYTTKAIPGGISIPTELTVQISPALNPRG